MIIKRAFAGKAVGVALAAVVVGGLAGFVGVAQAADKDADPVAATVGDYDIRLSDVEKARTLLPPQLQNQPLEAVYPLLLDSLINSHLAAEKARAMGLDNTLEYQKRMVRIGDQLLERMLLSQHIEKEITEDLVKERYAELVERAKTLSEVRTRHILLDTEAEALKMIKQLKSGANFAALAKEHSLGPSAPTGGDLGWVGPGRMVRAFEDAAMALMPGEYTAVPVKTQFGWHVIMAEERRPLAVPPFADARASLVNEISAELGQTLMDQLRTEAKVNKVDWSELK